MSRWIELFENHEFRPYWNKIAVISADLDIEGPTQTSDILELARLKKVVIFIENTLSQVDPELVPESTWTSFKTEAALCSQQLTNYEVQGDSSHLINANKKLDKLLGLVRPYHTDAHEAANAASNAFRGYAKTINAELSNFRDYAKGSLQQINDSKERAKQHEISSENSASLISSLESEYFDDSEKASLKSEIAQTKAEIDDLSESISQYAEKLLGGSGSAENSISNSIAITQSEVKQQAADIASALNATQKKLAELEKYHALVFGTDVGDKSSVGLKDEIANRQRELDEFHIEQETKCEALIDHIESLIPGVTSTGMAKAYYDMRCSFTKPIKFYSALFIGCVVALLFLAGLTVVDEIGLAGVKFVDVTELKSLFSNFLFKLPLALPVLWLALFASKRRSEASRLQQEYAHKEVSAKTYQNFKMQIEALNQSDPKLMESLLATTMDVVSKNASDTLDNKHGDQPPIINSVEKISKDIEKLVRSAETT